MKYKHSIMIFVFIAFSMNSYAQDKYSKYSKSGKQQSSQELLSKARSIHTKNPKGAIDILNKIINTKAKTRDDYEDAAAYTLLGDIYTNIKQYELALSRYEMAYKRVLKSKYGSEQTGLLWKMGQTHLMLQNDKQAFAKFNLCVTLGKTIYTDLCREGLADIELYRGNIQQSIDQFEDVQSGIPKADSVSNVRLYAKQSQAYSKENDYSNSREALNKSVDYLPKSKGSVEMDFVEIEKVVDDLNAIPGLDNFRKIDASKEVLPKVEELEPLAEISVIKNLEVASLYEEENRLIEASEYIDISKAAINKNTTSESIAKVYKKSAEINQKRGAIDEALKDLDRYIVAKEQSLRDLEQELALKIDIVTGQQKIDLNVKDLDIEVKEEELLHSQVRGQKWIIGLLSLLLGASFVFFYFLNKNVKGKRKANQLLLLKSLRTQMNPHFIFNALNSVNNFIAKNDEKAANKFLSDFSRLMRQVLDHSQKDLIGFEEEMELNELYLKLEHFRFRDKFEYEFIKNVDSKYFDLQIPPMLIQPFIENAVWHGLRYKESKGHLSVKVEEKNEFLLVSILDNGIGRSRSKAQKTANQKKYKSTGLDNVNRRIALINEVYKKNYVIETNDAYTDHDDVGTRVQIKIPI